MLPSNKNPKKILEPYYTNDDLQIVHNIIIRAEDVLPSLPRRERLPTNALFKAYYEWLEEVGLDADHDNHYSRILFKIGGLRGGGSLFDKFAEVLHKIGIEIEIRVPGEEFGNEKSDGRYVSSHGSDNADPTDYVEFETNGHGPRGRPRANSESSIWIGNDSTFQRNARTRSFSPGTQLNTEPFDPRNEQSSQRHRSDRRHSPDDRPWLIESNGHVSKHHRARSDSQRGRKITRSPSFEPAKHVSGSSSGNLERANNNTTQSLDGTNDTASDVINLASQRPPVPVYNPSTTLMELKSTLAYENHIKSLRRPFLRAWYTRAEKQRDHHHFLWKRAQDHDRDHLLRDTLDIWRHRLCARQNEENVRQFFQNSEERVERCRDRQLVTSAFQKWLKNAKVKLARTTDAQEKVLKLRYFNLWNKVTTVNEAEVEQHVLGKLYEHWKTKSDVITSNTKIAVGFYEANLIARVFRNWLHGSKEKHVRCSREAVQKEQVLGIWRDKLRVLKAKQVLVSEKHEARLLQSTLTTWRERMYVSSQAAVKAHIFFMDRYGRSLLQQSLSLWLHRTRLEREAAAKDREWCLKETLTALRMGLLSRRNNKRLARHALQSWQLAARLQVAKRVIDDRRKLQILQLMQDKRSVVLQNEADMETRAEGFRKRILQESAIRIWYQRMQLAQDRETTALNYHASNIAFNALDSWFKKHEQVQLMNRKADQVIYFFRVHKSMQRWNEATKDSRIGRGKAAYTQVRRTVKTRMARDVVAKWREKVQQVRQNQERAQEFRHNKNVVFSIEAFDRWRARTEDIGYMDVQAKTKSNQTLVKKPLQMWRVQAMANITLRKKLLSTQLSKWRQRVSDHERNEAKARDFFNNHTAVLCSRYLNKWSNDAFQIRIQIRTEQRVQELKAEEYLDRCNKKHFRKVFKYWRIRMLDKKGIDTNQLRQVSRIASTPAGKRSALGATARNEEWSAFDEGFDIQDLNHQLGATGSSTPTPLRRANLNQSLVKPSAVATPLRISAINQSLEKASTTPGTPLATPLERRLRKGLFSATPRTQPVARSALGRSVFTQGFADISEVSKEDSEEGKEI